MAEKKRILLIDDDAVFTHTRDIFSEVADHFSYPLDVAETPEAALMALTNRHYDLCVTDIDNATRLNQHGHTPPLCLLTYVDSAKERQTVRRIGGVGIVARHYSKEETGFVLNTLLWSEALAKKRAYPRVVAGTTGEISSSGQHVVGEMVNLSQGGAYIKCYEALERGTSVSISFGLDDGKLPMQCDGRIVYNKPYSLGGDLLMPGVGVLFEQMEEGSRSAIVSFVQERLI